MRIGGSTLSVLDFGNDFTTQIYRTVNDFVLCTSSTGSGQERMRITSTGNVGIGTATVSYPLHVQGQIYSSSQYILSSSIDSGLWFGNGDAALGRANGAGSYSSSAVAGDIILRSATANKLLLQSGGGASAIAITSGGNVGIGTATVNNILQVGSGWRLRISNGSTDRSIIGTNDDAGVTNTRIAVYGNTYSGYSGNIEYIATGTGDHIFFSGGGAAERMRITSTGNVGIGTNNPGFRLEVSGITATIAFNSYYLGLAGVGAYNGAYSACAKFNGEVWTTSYFFSSSDIRIKEDIQDILDDTALQSILSIEPKTYKYIDKLEKGDKKVYGFIAQQIKDVIPEAVSIQASYIPNIYLVADYIEGVITLSSQPTKVIIKMNEKIKCYDKDNKEILVEVIEVIDDLTFRIKEIEYTDTKIFVYGTFVDDFHTLNKDYIFTLNVCATQELHRRIEAQSVLLKSQDDRIKDLEAKVATLMSM